MLLLAFLACSSEAPDPSSQAPVPAPVALLKAALELSSDYGPAVIRLADLQLETGETETSETLYRQALELDPKLARAHYGLGRLLLARGDIAGAAERYRRASELEKNFRQAHYALGLAYRRLGESDKAKASLARYEQLRDQPEPSFDPVADAVGELAGGRRAAAGPSLDLPKSALEQAAAELEVALEKQPWLLSAHANLIGVYWELKKPEKAAEHYRAALKIDSEDATIHYNWAVMQNLSGDLPAAEKAFRRALGINPEYADAHVQYGALLERMDKQAEAVRHYRRAIGINPNDRRGNLRIGLLHVQAGRLGEAIPHLEKTILVDDRQSPIYMRILAGAHGQSGNHQRALALLREARKRAAALEMTAFVTQVDSELRALSEAAPQ